MSGKPIKGYKAFNKNMTCQGFQYEEGKTYKTEEAEICKTGFHFCENPLDVLNYYDIADSVFCEVLATGKTDREKDRDSKVCTTEITIGKRLSLKEFIDAAVEYWSQNASSGDGSQNASSGDWSKNASSGNESKNASSGYGSKNASSGDGSQNASSGDLSQIEMTGKDSVGVSAGRECKIKGVVGCWVTLAEWRYDKAKNRFVPVYVKSARIDGKKLKADTWYTLKNGKFVEAE